MRSQNSARQCLQPNRPQPDPLITYTDGTRCRRDLDPLKTPDRSKATRDQQDKLTWRSGVGVK